MVLALRSSALTPFHNAWSIKKLEGHCCVVKKSLRLYSTGSAKNKYNTFNNSNNKRKKINDKINKNNSGDNNNGSPSSTSFEYFTDEGLKHNVKDFVEVLRHRSSNSDTELTSVELRQLLSLLSIHINNLTPTYFTSIVFSIGLIATNADRLRGFSIRENDVKLLMTQLHRFIDSFNLVEISRVLVSFARLNINWNVITIEDREKFQGMLSSNVLKMDERSVGDVIWALGAMGTSWSSLSPSCQSSILNALQSKLPLFTSYSLSSALWALAKMGVRFSDLPLEAQKILPASLHNQLKDMSPQQSSKTVWALGTMGGGVSQNTISIETLALYIDNVSKIKRSKMGYAIPASQVLTGVAKMGISWKRLSPDVKNNLWDSFDRVLSSANDKGAANALWAMGTLGVSSNEQPKIIQDTMWSALSRMMLECSPWSFCNIVWGLAKMKYMWPDLPVNIQDILLANMIRLEGEMNRIDTGILLYSIGSMDVPLDTLPSSLLDSVYKSVLRNLEGMKSQELSRTIWGLSSSGLKWDSLPDPVRWNINVALRRVCDDMSIQDIANCAYGLAMLAFDAQNPDDAAFRGAHETVLSAIIKQRKNKAILGNSEIEQLRIFSQYLRVMSYTSDVKKIPSEYLQPLSQHDNSSDANGYVGQALGGSALQDRVMKGITDAIALSKTTHVINLNPEASSFDGVFPVDAAVSYDDEVVALIEVDGPHHYRHDGKLRRKDLLKEAMYQKKFPHCELHRIRWDEANKMGSDVVGRAVVEILVGTINERNEKAKNVFKSMRLSFNNFFEWGLRNNG